MFNYISNTNNQHFNKILKQNYIIIVGILSRIHLYYRKTFHDDTSHDAVSHYVNRPFVSGKYQLFTYQ